MDNGWVVPGRIGLLDTTVSFEWTVTLPFLLDIIAKRNSLCERERERERDGVAEKKRQDYYWPGGGNCEFIMREAGVR
jgi:hypothetical protein